MPEPSEDEVRINIGCGPHYAPGWVNLDYHRGDGVEPDLQTVPGEPLPFFPDSVDRIYAGHVFEHVPRPDIDAFAAELYSILRPGGRICVVGPDVLRTLKGWKAGRLPYDLVLSVLESDDVYMTDAVTDDWPHARHWWNCTGDRVKAVLNRAGFTSVTERDITRPGADPALAEWPVVGFNEWQFAVEAQK